MSSAATSSPTTTGPSPSHLFTRNPSFKPLTKTCSTTYLKNHFFKPLTKTTTSFTLTHKTLSPVSSKNPISDVNPDDDQGITFDYNPHPESGIVGIYGDPEASRICHLALLPFQSPSQKAAEIITATPDGILKSLTGIIKSPFEVFDKSKLDELPGHNAIGQSMVNNVQPFVASYRFGRVAVAHNGNLVNYQTLRAELEQNGCVFSTCSDTEVVLHLIAISEQTTFIKKVVEACQKLKGTYSMLFLTEDKLVAVTDPFRCRPLSMGRRNNGAIVFASDTVAFYIIQADYVRQLRPGEVLIIDKDGEQSSCLMPHPKEPKLCIFELFKFLYTNPVLLGKSVSKLRKKFGEILATDSPVDCDVVIESPDDPGSSAAIGYANKSGVPFKLALHKSDYFRRTFIEPSQQIQDIGFQFKLSPIQTMLEGKRVVVVGDSMVSGTSSSKIVRLLKEVGAKEVHIRIASPRIITSCYYGVYTPSPELLISNRMSVEEIRESIGCDSLAFLKLDSLKKMLAGDLSKFCYACFSGNNPVVTK